MNATPLLSRLLAACAAEHLEIVLIGNAAAALHGAPVTTLDFDFMFRDTPTNMRKLKRVAAALGGMILRPYYPVSRLYRLVHDASGLQADFMPVIHGVRSFEGLKARAVCRDMDGETILVASLGDIIASKRAANREQDRAVLPILEELSEMLGRGTLPTPKKTAGKKVAEKTSAATPARRRKRT